MTDNNHPITPPKEMVKQWVAEIWHEGAPVQVAADNLYIATQAARWGADQELEACCEWLQDPDLNVDTYKLRAFRRPKPLSLKYQALEQCNDYIDPDGIIRRALEQLND